MDVAHAEPQLRYHDYSLIGNPFQQPVLAGILRDVCVILARAEVLSLQDYENNGESSVTLKDGWMFEQHTSTALASETAMDNKRLD